MNYEMMQGRLKQLHGWSLEIRGKKQSDHLLWAKGLHKRIEGLMQYNQGRVRLAVMRADHRR